MGGERRQSYEVSCSPTPHFDTPMVLPPPLVPRGPPYLQAGHEKPGERTDGAMGGRRVGRKTGDAGVWGLRMSNPVCICSLSQI